MTKDFGNAGYASGGGISTDVNAGGKYSGFVIVIYPENIRGTILQKHSWIAGQPAAVGNAEPATSQTSRVTRIGTSPDVDMVTEKGVASVSRSAISDMIALVFMQ